MLNRTIRRDQEEDGAGFYPPRLIYRTMLKMRKIGKIVIITLVLLGVFRVGDIFLNARFNYSDNEATIYVLSFSALVGLVIIIVYLIKKNNKK